MMPADESKTWMNTANVPTHTRKYTRTHTQMQTHRCARAYTHIHTHTYAHTHVHTCSHLHTLTHTNTDVVPSRLQDLRCHLTHTAVSHHHDNRRGLSPSLPLSLSRPLVAIITYPLLLPRGQSFHQGQLDAACKRPLQVAGVSSNTSFLAELSSSGPSESTECRAPPLFLRLVLLRRTSHRWRRTQTQLELQAPLHEGSILNIEHLLYYSDKVATRLSVRLYLSSFS